MLTISEMKFKDKMVRSKSTSLNMSGGGGGGGAVRRGPHVGKKVMAGGGEMGGEGVLVVAVIK